MSCCGRKTHSSHTNVDKTWSENSGLWEHFTVMKPEVDDCLSTRSNCNNFMLYGNMNCVHDSGPHVAMSGVMTNFVPHGMKENYSEKFRSTNTGTCHCINECSNYVHSYDVLNCMKKCTGCYK